MKTAIKQAAENFSGEYKATDINSSITVAYDSSPGLYIQEFVYDLTFVQRSLDSWVSGSPQI